MNSHATDEFGNPICYDCMAHVPPHLVDSHVCPPFLKMIFSKKRKDEAYIAKRIENTNLNVPIEYREKEMNDEL